MVSKFFLGFLILCSFTASAQTFCADGKAGLYPCTNVDLMSTIDLGVSGLYTAPLPLHNGKGSGAWGWTDPDTQREYAIMGLVNKTSIVDITDALQPVHVVDIPTQTIASLWREVITYRNYLLIVSEAHGHGMQIFDLRQLSKLSRDRVHILEASAHYPYFGSSHTITANNETGFAYALGSDTCDAGAHVIDMKSPLRPVFSTCIDRKVFDPLSKLKLRMSGGPDKDETYTHDMLCVVYKGPDERYRGREICVASNDNSLNIVDATDKSDPRQIGVGVHENAGFVHQGWFTEDQGYFLVNDELDEEFLGGNMKTYIYDLRDLENPKSIGFHDHGYRSIDHNLYVKGNYVYEANYLAGLSVLNLNKVAEGQLIEVGRFDTTPGADGVAFNGVWNVYPFFKSGNVILSQIDDGVMFIVRPNLSQ